MYEQTALNRAIAKYAQRGYTLEIQTDQLAILVKTRKPRIFLNLILAVLTLGFWIPIWLYLLVTRRKVVEIWFDSTGNIVESEKNQLSAQKVIKWVGENKLVASALGIFLLVAIIFNSTLNYLQKDSVEASPSSTETAETPDYPVNLEQALSGKQIDFSEATCQSMSAAIKNKVEEKDLVRRGKALDKIDDSWEAKEYLIENPWAGVPVASTFDLQLKTITVRELDAALNATKKDLVDLIKLESPSSYDVMRAESVSMALEQCALVEEFDSVSQTIASFDTSVAKINKLAASAPWYPKGFTAYDDSLAYKFITNRGCSYGDSCWNIDVVSAYGCSTLYVELNVLDSSGAIIDYTNDLAGNVGPNQIAKLQLATYANGADKGQITQILCY